jgi:hypothetical protein
MITVSWRTWNWIHENCTYDNPLQSLPKSCAWVQWSSIGRMNCDSLCDWMLGDFFFFFFFVSLCFDVCFALLWRIPARLFFIYWQIDLFTCISSLTLHLYFIVYFAFDKYLFVFSLWLKFILSWWSSDCIGSAFNVKGAMQCPNCRKIEKGQWLYANGCRSLPEFTMDDWAHDEDLYDLSYSEMVNGFFFPS